MADNINPDHYKRLPVEAIEIIESAIEGAPTSQEAYLQGQALKYLLRANHKNGREDIHKAKWYLDRMVASFTVPSDLLDHPSWTYEIDPAEQPKATLNSDKIHEGDRKLKDSSEEPRQLGDLRWSVAERRYVEISVDEIGYANRDNWAACRKVTEEVDVEWVDAVWPQDFGQPARFWPNPICQNEGIPDDSLWDLGTVAGYVADGYRKWIIEMDGKISCHMYCQVKKKVEPAIKQSLTLQPPDGWRFLELGEVIRKGDQGFEKGLFHAIEPIKLGMTLQSHWMPTIRRNRFEIGEKVVYIQDESVWDYISEINDGPNHPKSAHVASGSTSLRVCVTRLAPYIEDAK